MRREKQEFTDYVRVFQSTHLVWGATLTEYKKVQDENISIHAPRVRCDWNIRQLLLYLLYFNPRTSCEVRPRCRRNRQLPFFISIHAPRVRCDSCHSPLLFFESNFNPRTSCEVRHLLRRKNMATQAISIHAPRVRCDYILQVFSKNIAIFQSTHLVWGATLQLLMLFLHFFYFNPRTSCEVRPPLTAVGKMLGLFQSTHLVWGATRGAVNDFLKNNISIHAPRVRCDISSRFLKHWLLYFNPRTSCEVRRHV